jgi:hypothetical protein
MEEKLENAHKHFRTVLSCAILVATINGGGQSKLFSEHQAEENNLRSLLSFVPAVLVRNNEVIAAVAHRSRPPTSVSGAAIGSLHVYIVQNSSVTGSSEQGEPATEIGELPAVTAIPNPYVQDLSQGDPYFTENVPGPDCLIVKSGRSHLHSVGDLSKWERYIFEIK